MVQYATSTSRIVTVRQEVSPVQSSAFHTTIYFEKMTLKGCFMITSMCRLSDLFDSTRLLSAAVSSPPGPAGCSPSADRSSAQTGCGGSAWTHGACSIFLLPPPPSPQTSPTCREEEKRSGIQQIRSCYSAAVRMID